MMNPAEGPPVDRSLEIDGETLRLWTEQVMVHVQEYVRTLPQQSMGTQTPVIPVPDLEPVPRSGQPLEVLLQDLFQRAIPDSFNTASPGYLGYIPGGGLLHAALADFIAAAVNRYMGVFSAAPHLAALEAQVLRWFADLMGLPSSARGLLTTGGSMANLTAVVTARTSLLPANFLNGVLYAGNQVHHSINKAARLAGFPDTQVRSLPVDSCWRLSVPALEESVAADRAAGRQPFMVVASGGTVNTGAVDDLDALADVCARQGLWLHVDAAYGGFFRLCETGRLALQGIHRADSISLDPHKGLFMPYGTGALLVRDGALLRRAHTVAADYMPSMQESDHPLEQDFCNYGLELSRELRGLRIWLPLKLHGLDPFVVNLEEKLALARHAGRQLARMDGVELVAEPQLSVVTFRLRRDGLSNADTDLLNHRLLERIQARDRVFLNATRLGGLMAIRLCVLSFRTHLEHVEEALAIIASACDEV